MAILAITVRCGTFVAAEQVDIPDLVITRAVARAIDRVVGALTAGQRFEDQLEHPTRRCLVRPAAPRLVHPATVAWHEAGVFIGVEGPGGLVWVRRIVFHSHEWRERQTEWDLRDQLFWEHVVRIAMNGALNISVEAATSTASRSAE